MQNAANNMLFSTLFLGLGTVAVVVSICTLDLGDMSDCMCVSMIIMSTRNSP